MRNPDQEPIKDEEIPNMEQFQMNRSEGNAADAREPKEQDDDENYKEEEIPFADGKGTQLDEAIDEQQEEKEEND